LISLGIDYKAKDINGQTALDMANETKQTHISTFLEAVEKK